MRHLFNRISGKWFCDISKPKVTDNTSDLGQLLGHDDEQWCRVCVKWKPEYYKQRLSQQDRHEPEATTDTLKSALEE